MISARQVALEVLGKVDLGKHPLDHWIDAADAKIGSMDQKDRALTHAIIYGTLRWQGNLDFIIDSLARKPKKIDPRLRLILRMALFQLTQLDRIPPSAVVNTAVDLAKKNQRAWGAGFVNGLLRKATREMQNIPWPDWDRFPESALATRLAFPQWLATRWINRWGLDEARQMATTINTIPSIVIRTNTLKTTREQLSCAVASEARQIRNCEHTPEGITLSALVRPFPQWPPFIDGWFQIQDEAAQLVSHCLAPESGETVWDACAGLGTKTAHLAQLMGNKGKIIASDRTSSKIEKLQEEMHRLGINIVTGQTLDLTRASFQMAIPQFDKILVDAPCSGLGVLQKNPDGKWHTHMDDLVRHHKRQVELLHRAAGFLRPEGRMVYSVCSREPEENEDVIKAFLQKHPEFAIYIPRLIAVPQPDKLLTPQGWLATLPHTSGMDGFFAAVLIKTK